MRRFVLEASLYTLGFLVMNWMLGGWLKSYEMEDLAASKLQFTGLAWNEYYDDPNVDLVILGSSHAYRSYDPRIIDRQLPDISRSFNFGSPAQSLTSSYYVLEEVLRHSKPKAVVLDIYFMVSTSDDQMKNGRLIWQSISAEGSKRFFRHAFSPDEQLLLKLLPAYVYRHRLKPKIKAQLGLPHLPVTEGYYCERGFATWNDTIDLDMLTADNQFDYFSIDTSDLTSKNIASLYKIIALCQTNQIQLIFAAAPMPAITVTKVETYGHFYDFFSALANKFSIPYLDYNQYRSQMIKDDDHFYNDDHLNSDGAKLFSLEFASDLDSIWNTKEQ